LGIVTKTMQEFLDSDRKTTDYTTNGHCSNCGGCCTNLLPVTEKEIFEIKKFIKRNNIKACNKINRILAKPTVDLTCPFRDEENQICTIYSVRPKICRGFMCRHNDDDIQNFANELKKERIEYKMVFVKDTFFE